MRAYKHAHMWVCTMTEVTIDHWIRRTVGPSQRGRASGREWAKEGARTKGEDEETRARRTHNAIDNPESF